MAPPGNSSTLRPELAPLIADIQSRGLRIERSGETTRVGGAGPSDAGMISIEGVNITAPVGSSFVTESPYTLREDIFGEWGVYMGEERVATAELAERPRYYDLTTDDGIPYWKIALLHLDSLASTVVQKCAYWGTDDQCKFCGIELTLESGSTIAAKRPEHLAEVAVAAQELDHVVDITLTTGSTYGPDKGALYLGRCAEAMHNATGLSVEAQFEPPEDLDVLDQVHDMGVSSVGIHVESFDPATLADIAPPKARTGIEGYFKAWERAIEVFGVGQVSTYVILGMGEDPDLTVAGCKRAIDMGVYPFIVPLRPVPGSLLENLLPPDAAYMESIYRRVVPYLVERGIGSWNVSAGCARCQACSGMSLIEQEYIELSPSNKNRTRIPLRSVD